MYILKDEKNYNNHQFLDILQSWNLLWVIDQTGHFVCTSVWNKGLVLVPVIWEVITTKFKTMAGTVAVI